MNPFINDVVNPTAQLLNQQQQAQMSGQTGNAIKSGAFGGDRAGIAAANLAGQQSLSFANAINPLYSQAYDKGLGTAQQQQGFNLGQQQANLGRLSQAGQQFGALGTGAQTAALQGAQSQLAAGQVAQQTEQAGRSALYNQFLQQQGYPFQTAQFLANIAEGTGALSGSTTTTTQPAPFFSDERLKDDVESIGKTYDGQNIIKFRYKGSPHTQIGLSAQNVEKHHPDAVGLAGGYKTVDYDAATKHAAERGHFYDGGLASQGGAVDMQSMGEGFAEGGAPGLAIFGMPGSQNTNAGLATALAAGTPARARKLMQPMTPPRQITPELTQIAQGVAGGNDIVKTLGTASDTLGKAKNWWNGQQSTAARGGLIGYAQGGDVDDANPYDDPAIANGNVPKALNIPNDQSHYTLGGAGKQGGSGSGGGGGQQSGLGQIASGVKDIATIGTGIESLMEFLPFLALKNGGAVRQGLAGGGPPEDYPPEADMPALGAAYANYEKPRNPTFAEVAAIAADEAKKQGLDPRVVTNVIRGEYGNGSKYVGDDGSSGGSLQLHYGNTASKYPHPGLGDEFTKQTGLDARDPSTYEASTRFGVQQMAKLGLTPWLNTMNKFGYAPDSAHTGQGGLGAISRAAPDQVAQNGAGPQPGLGAAPSYNQGPPTEGLAKKFEDNKGWLIPLLSGLGKMASSNSRYLGSAVLQGVGAGAEEYGKLQVQQAGIGNTESSTGFNRAQTAKTLAETSQSGMNADMVPLANGTYMPKTLWLADYFKGIVHPTRLGNEAALAAAAAGAGVSGTAQHGAPTLPPVPAVAPIGGAGQPAPSASPQEPAQQGQPQQRVGMLGESGHKALDADYQKLLTQKLSNPETYAADMARSKDVGDQAQSAWSASRAQGSTLNQIAPQIIGLPDEGPLQTGPLNKIKLAAISRINDIARTFSGASQFQILPEEVGTENAIRKLSGLMQFATAHNASQNSLSALETASHVVPSTDLDKNGAVKVMAGMYMDKQQAIDFHRYLDEYTAMAAKKYPGMQGNYLAQSAASAFAEDHPTTQYAQEKEALTRLMNAKYKGAPILPQLIHGDLPFSAVMKSKQLNLPAGLDRYFKDN